MSAALNRLWSTPELSVAPMVSPGPQRSVRRLAVKAASECR